MVHALAPAPEGVLADLDADITRRFETQSGFHLVSANESGMRWRLAMVEHATTSLDLMYFIWQEDPSGGLLFDRLLAAADRGVRVRLIVDDMTLAAKDKNLAAVCLHPNFEIKLYNPIKVREGLVGTPWAFLTRMKRSNRRMHNKLMVADHHLAIIGGRNVGDEYYGLAKKYNFRDMDVLAVGPIVDGLVSGFDEYWNASITYPARALSSDESTADLEDLRRGLGAALADWRDDLVSYPVDRADFATALQSLGTRMVGGKAWVVQDDPVHIHGQSLRLVDMLGYLTDGVVSKDILVSSPYLIPVGDFLASLKEATENGTRVRLLTGSLGSNNHTSAHAHYAKYRRRILATGAELYEFHHEPAADIRQASDVPPARATFISAHMKTMVADRERCYIGSLNLDPRAIDLNTENGLYIESKELGEQLATEMERMMHPANAWQVKQNVYDELYWTRGQGRVYRQPARKFTQRIVSFFFRLLPIEKQL